MRENNKGTIRSFALSLEDGRIQRTNTRKDRRYESITGTNG